MKRAIGKKCKLIILLRKLRPGLRMKKPFILEKIFFSKQQIITKMKQSYFNHEVNSFTDSQSILQAWNSRDKY